jgi:type IX secretion system PorP/SprF family membrane protein
MKRRTPQRYIITALCCICLYVTKAQDIHFSQFYETSILRNPSLTGLFADDYKVAALYRNQWSSISKPFQTGMVNIESRFLLNEVNDYLSVGILGYYDKAGSVNLTTNAFYPAVNYNKSLKDGNNSYLSVGFAGGYIQRNYDPSKATYNNQFLNGSYSPNNPTGESNNTGKFNYWDLGAGVTYSSTAGNPDNGLNYIIGLAGYHFLQPVTSFEKNSGVRLGMKWNLNVSLSKQVNDKFSFQIHGNYSKQASYNEIILGGMLGWNRKGPNGELLFILYGGAYIRIGDAVIPTIRMRYKDVSFTLAYDLNLSKLRTATNSRGGFELSIIKTGLINNPEHAKSRTICPEFY